jgi:hypothetical protein
MIKKKRNKNKNIFTYFFYFIILYIYYVYNIYIDFMVNHKQLKIGQHQIYNIYHHNKRKK